MKSDPASLDNLADIYVPPPVSWWPPAAGWWIVFAVLVLAMLIGVIRAWKSWNANAYRRAAMRELQEAANLSEVSGILKRTALCAFPREQVASLSGWEWAVWLGKTAPIDVPDKVAECLAGGVFGIVESSCTDELREFTRAWITRHQIPTEHQ